MAAAMDLFAGSGLCLGPRNLLGEYAHLPTVTITHPCLREELDAVAEQDPARALVAFDRACIRHFGFLCSNALRTLALGLTRGWLVPLPIRTRSLARHYQQVSRFSAAFALAADVLLLAVRGHFKRHERLSARMADIWSELHVASAALQCAQAAPDEAARVPARWVLADCIARIGRSFDALCANLPRRSARILLRRFIFPYGRLPRGPGDGVDVRLARVLLVPSSSRDRLSAGMYVPSDPRDPLSRLEHALDLVVRSTPALRKLRDAAKVSLIRGDTVSEQLECALAAGVLNADEAQLLREAEVARHEALRVDEFQMPSCPDAFAEGRG
jgi:acyl-CoA dehydrogenase